MRNTSLHWKIRQNLTFFVSPSLPPLFELPFPLFPLQFTVSFPYPPLPPPPEKVLFDLSRSFYCILRAIRDSKIPSGFWLLSSVCKLPLWTSIKITTNMWKYWKNLLPFLYVTFSVLQDSLYLPFASKNAARLIMSHNIQYCSVTKNSELKCSLWKIFPLNLAQPISYTVESFLRQVI